MNHDATVNDEQTTPHNELQCPSLPSLDSLQCVLVPVSLSPDPSLRCAPGLASHAHTGHS